MHIRIGNQLDYLEKYNIAYTDLIEMDSMGIISFDMATSMTVDYKKDNNPTLLFYHREPHYLYSINRERVTEFPVFPVTSLGNCLVPIAGSVRNEEYYLESIDTFTKAGLNISDKPPRK